MMTAHNTLRLCHSGMDKRSLYAFELFLSRVGPNACQISDEESADVAFIDLDNELGPYLLEGHRLLGDIEGIEQVVEHGTVGVEDDALERADAQVLQRDGVLVAHGLQVTSEHAGDGFHLGLGAEGTDALDLFGQDHIVVRDVRNDEGAHGALATCANRAGRPWRHRGQQVEHPVLLFDDDLPGTHGFGRKQVECFHATVAVGNDIDGRRECRHRESRGVEHIVHGDEFLKRIDG